MFNNPQQTVWLSKSQFLTILKMLTYVKNHEEHNDPKNHKDVVTLTTNTKYVNAHESQFDDGLNISHTSMPAEAPAMRLPINRSAPPKTNACHILHIL